jgi:hypothetical protein
MIEMPKEVENEPNTGLTKNKGETSVVLSRYNYRKKSHIKLTLEQDPDIAM